MVEWRVSESLVQKTHPDKIYKIKDRRRIDYFGDGMYTNSSEEMERELKKAGIITGSMD